MGTLGIRIGEKVEKYSYPKTWDELSPKMYRKICALISSGTEMSKVRLEVISHLLKLRIGVTKPSEETSHVFRLPTVYLHTITDSPEILGWVFGSSGPKKMMIPHFHHNGVRYLAPPGSLTNVCTIELIAAYHSFMAYSKTQDISHLDRLISLLYRKRDRWRFFKPFALRFNKDRREPLNQARWEERQKALSGLPMGLKVAILKQFSSQWSVFESRFTTIFTRTAAKESDQSGLMNMLYDVSGKIFGTMEQTEMSPADKVFKYVELQIRQNKELEKKYKLNKK